jgi:hypothetical protein
MFTLHSQAEHDLTPPCPLLPLPAIAAVTTAVGRWCRPTRPPARGCFSANARSALPYGQRWRTAPFMAQAEYTTSVPGAPGVYVNNFRVACFASSGR